MQLRTAALPVKFNRRGYIPIAIIMLTILAAKIFSQFAGPSRNEGLELATDLLFAATFFSVIVICFRSFDGFLKARDEENVRLFRKNPHPMWIYDLQTLKFLAVNEAAVAMYGYSEREFMELTLKDIHLPEDMPALTLAGQSDFNHEYKWFGVSRHKLKNGKLLYAEISAYEIIFHRKKARLVMAYNVTEKVLQDQKMHAMNQELERKILERTDDLLQLNKQLINQNRIIKSANLELFSLTRDLKEANNKIREQADLKHKFVSMASHELRTPLANIASTVGRIRNDISALPPRLISQVKGIEKQLEHLFCVLDDVLTLGKDESGKLQVKPRELDIRSFVSKVVEEVGIASANSHKIVVTMHESTPMVVVSDQNFLRNIFINLLSNAIKYSPGKDSVFLDIYPDRNTISFEVRDRGLGIRPDEIDRIFEPFFRSHNTNGIAGTGLGLSIVKRAAELLNASIHVKSEAGKGSTFRVLLPLQEVW